MKTEKGKLYVEQLKDGRFQFRYRYKDYRTGKYHRISCIKASNSRQAYNQALRELQERAVDAFVSRPKLKEALSLYLSDKKRVLRPQTLIRNERGIRVVNDAIGDVYLDTLTVLIIRNALASCSPSNTTYNERLARYKAFLSWCFQSDLLSEDLAARLQPLPDNKRERIQDKYLEPEELQKLLDGMKVPMWYYLTYFMALSGLRIGEAIALEIDDINKYIDVNKTFSLVIYKVGSTKTDTSARQVFVQPELRALLDQYMIFRAEFLNGKKSRLLFPSRDGSFMCYAAYNKYLKENSLRILGRVISTHALRHTSASLFLAAGVPLETISRRLGHSSSRITKEIYLHITERLKAADEAAVASAQILP